MTTLDSHDLRYLSPPPLGQPWEALTLAVSPFRRPTSNPSGAHISYDTAFVVENATTATTTTVTQVLVSGVASGASVYDVAMNRKAPILFNREPLATSITDTVTLASQEQITRKD